MTTTIDPERLELDDLEWFIRLSGLVGFEHFSVSKTRDRQDAELTEQLRQQALALIRDRRLIQVTDDSFFLGSVDCMVRDTPNGQTGYTVLETNGGSSRGLTRLSPPDVERLIAGFVEMLRFVDADEPPLIVVGHPDDDYLITEKILTIYRIKEALERERPSLKVDVVSIDGFRTMCQAKDNEAVIVLAPYSQTMLSLYLKDDQVYLLNRRVHLIIGDGVARRHHQMKHQRANVVLANWIFPVSDDKFLTYKAIERTQDKLTPHGLCPMRFWRAWSQEELEQICAEKRSEVDGLIIKPCRGSGGAGVLPVLPDSTVPEVVAGSLDEFYTKFGRSHNPFPYTICEKINPRKATWRGNRHNYDIRVYVARQGDTLIPAGCFFRLAPKPDKGTYSKESLIVNLSGYGAPANERSLELSEESLQIVHLEKEDIVRIFAASTLLMAAIAHQPIDWS